MDLSEKLFRPSFLFTEPFVHALTRPPFDPNSTARTLLKYRAVRAVTVVKEADSTLVSADLSDWTLAPLARYELANKFQLGAEVNLSNSLWPLDNLRLKGWFSLPEVRQGPSSKTLNLGLSYAFPTPMRLNLAKVFWKDVASWARSKRVFGVKLKWPVRDFSASLLLESEPTFARRGPRDQFGVPKLRLRHSSNHYFKATESYRVCNLAVLELPLFEPSLLAEPFSAVLPEWFGFLRSRLTLKTKGKLGNGFLEVGALFAVSNRFRDLSHLMRGCRVHSPPDGRHRVSTNQRALEALLGWSFGSLMKAHKAALFAYCSLYSSETVKDQKPQSDISFDWGVGARLRLSKDLWAEGLLDLASEGLRLRFQKC